MHAQDCTANTTPVRLYTLPATTPYRSTQHQPPSIHVECTTFITSKLPTKHTLLNCFSIMNVIMIIQYTHPYNTAVKA